MYHQALIEGELRGAELIDMEHGREYISGGGALDSGREGSRRSGNTLKPSFCRSPSSQEYTIRGFQNKQDIGDGSNILLL